MSDDIYGLREDLAKLVGLIDDDSEYKERVNKNVQIMVSNDVTGSLGVWGINQECHYL